MKRIGEITLLVFVFITAFSCKPVSDINTDMPSDDEFLKFANIFMEELDVEKIDKYAVEAGMYIRHNPGAFTVISKLDDTVKKDHNLNFLFIKPGRFNPVKGDIPIFECGKGWNKKGCFCSSGKSNILLNTLDLMIEYDLGEVSEEDKMYKQAEKYAKAKSYIIYDTASFSGYYFVYINGQFRLYMIDRHDPCSA